MIQQDKDSSIVQPPQIIHDDTDDSVICRPLLEVDQEEANRNFGQNAELILSPNTASKLDYDLNQYLQMIYTQSIEEYVSEQ